MPIPSLDSLTQGRVLFVFAHPDDESIGLGGILDQFRDPRFACLTDGAPREPAYAHAAGCATPVAYARLRRRELAIALALAGHGSERLIALGFTDQELAHSLEGITQAVEVLLQRVQPDFVVTHAYEGGHPDHDATAFAVHTAIAAHAGHEPAPTIVEMTSYHARDGEIEWGNFLPDPEQEETTIELTPAQRAQKRRLLATHASQSAVLRDVPLDRERLRFAPRYDFSHPPHAGRLFYENFEWGLTGEQWCRAATVALERLHLTPLASAAY
jgi:LmbE family N-acetylglucosaminyl deacetylase